MYLIGLTLEGQFPSRMQGVGDSLVLSPFPSFPSNSSAQGHSQLEAPSGHPARPRGSVIHGGGFNNHGAKGPRAPAFSFPHPMGPSKVETAGAGEGEETPLPAPPQPCSGILCAGNEKPSVAMETAIPCSLSHSLWAVLVCNMEMQGSLLPRGLEFRRTISGSGDAGVDGR